ncbi:MAG TPA: SUMF1/EgtB/PvdO family nonheme iron enzyme, partial [Polyangiaceae bacterium]|nr:SUMF1/EgtB/PvdO family nonheme iron enzyme [Polyangiaceae bacterium]
GVAVVAVAFGVGFYSAPRRQIPRVVLAPAEPSSLPTCAPGLALLPGGVCLDQAEVTAGQYQACVRAGACESAQREFEPVAATGENPSLGSETARCNAGLPGRESYPINCVTFQQGRRFCEWRGGRLPTRSEWEFAATAGGSVPARDLGGGVSEWTVEPASPHAADVDATRERYVVLGDGLDRGIGAGGALSRLYMNANAQGRSVGFRCVVALDVAPARRTAAE